MQDLRKLLMQCWLMELFDFISVNTYDYVRLRSNQKGQAKFHDFYTLCIGLMMIELYYLSFSLCLYRLQKTNKNTDFLEVVIRCDRQYRNTLDWIQIDDLDIDAANKSNSMDQQGCVDFFSLNQNWTVKSAEALQSMFRLDESQISTPPRA